jgi:hypothetical protein
VTDKVINSVLLMSCPDGWQFRISFADGSSIESEQPYPTREAALRAVDDALSISQDGSGVNRLTRG